MKLSKSILDLRRRAGQSIWNWKSIQLSKKVIIIESDDWGSSRIESKSDLIRIKSLISSANNDPYMNYDGMASSKDLEHMYSVLNSIKADNKSPIITANFCMANPDFEKIRKSNFQEFYFERFDTTLKNRFKDATTTLKLWDEGRCEGFVFPQLHGREHLHALGWLEELQGGNKALHAVFDLGVYGITYKSNVRKQRRHNFQAALDIYGIKDETKFHLEWINDGAHLFNDYFGYPSDSFIAPAYIWPSIYNQSLSRAGVKSIQGLKLQYEPHSNGYKKKIRFMGGKCKDSNLFFFPRNVFFEPSLNPQQDWYGSTINGILTAFELKQPAVIGCHRLNFIGKLDERNRNNNLQLLQSILKKVISIHPDVVFASSNELLGMLIEECKIE